MVEGWAGAGERGEEGLVTVSEFAGLFDLKYTITAATSAAPIPPTSQMLAGGLEGVELRGREGERNRTRGVFLHLSSRCILIYK